MAGDPLLLIDGNSLTYRAFFALPTDMSTAAGQVTNAVFGVTSMLINLMRDHGSGRVAVAFDRPEPTFRHERIDTYKANRDAAPDILRQQMGLVRQVIETLGIPIIELPGFEADDIIATLATEARDAAVDVIIVTGDRDTYQLVEDPHVKVLYNRRGVSDYVLYDEAGIAERTGVPPRLYVPYAALRGDPSDNLPGVPGVGEKTAARLITKYDGVEGLYEHVDEQTPKLRTNLTEHEGQVRLNTEVMVLVRDAPVPATIDDLVRQPHDADELARLFDFLEFHTLGERLAEALGMVERAVAANPQSGAMIDSLGWAHYRLGDYKKSVDLLEQAVELEAGDPEINNHLGDAYWRVGRRIEAEYQWRRVLTLDPDAKIKADVEAKLASGQGPRGPAAAPRIAGQ